MGVVFIVVFLFFGMIGSVGGDGASSGFAFLGLLLGFCASVFYGFFLEGYWDGYTVGKKLLGIKVVKEDGSPCTYGSTLLRNLLEIIDGLFYYVVGFIFMASGDKRQRLGDRVAGTVVVNEQPQNVGTTTEMAPEREVAP
jgi:uncharacterized RDD family membrane protein YckC